MTFTTDLELSFKLQISCSHTVTVKIVGIFGAIIRVSSSKSREHIAHRPNFFPCFFDEWNTACLSYIFYWLLQRGLHDNIYVFNIYISHILLCFQFIKIIFYYPWNPKLYFYRNLTVSFPLIDSFKIFGVQCLFSDDNWLASRNHEAHHLGTWPVSGKSFITFHFFGLM